MLKKYVDRAIATRGVTFVGRLGSYRYLDMDVTIGEALAAADAMLERIAQGADIPAFFVPPLQHVITVIMRRPDAQSSFALTGSSGMTDMSFFRHRHRKSHSSAQPIDNRLAISSIANLPSRIDKKISLNDLNTNFNARHRKYPVVLLVDKQSCFYKSSDIAKFFHDRSH